MIAALLALTISAAPPVASSSPRTKILVMEFKDNGVGVDVVSTVGETLVAHLSADPRLQVTSSEDIRRVIAAEAIRIELGCDTDSCMAEIADALGAQYTLYGTAGKLGELTVVSVSLFDAKTATSIARENVEVTSLDALPPALRNAGDRIVATLGVADEEGPSALLMGGAGLMGVGLITSIVGAIFWVPNINGYQEPTRDFEQKSESRANEVGGGAAVAIGLGAATVGGALLALSFALE